MAKTKPIFPKLERNQNPGEKDVYPKMVISPDFGIGKVTGIECPNDDGVEYYVIEYGMRVKGYFPINGNRPFRFLASSATIKQALLKLNKSIEQKKFADRKEQVAYFKDLALVQDAMSMAKSINEFYQSKDLGVIEMKLMEKLIDSLALEMSIVLEISQDETKAIINKKLTGKTPIVKLNAPLA